jgi:ParB-like chromosome segregation protein Spo0J
MNFEEISIEKILSNPNNPRANISRIGTKIKYPKQIKPSQELVESIKTIGLINPITVIQQKDSYQIITGQRRFEAIKELGWQKIPCIIAESKDAYNKTLAENLVRKKLNIIEEAEGVDFLLKNKHGISYLTILNSPEENIKKLAILRDLKSFNVSIVRAKNLAKILFLEPIYKQRIIQEHLSLEEANLLLNQKDLSIRDSAIKKFGNVSKEKIFEELRYAQSEQEDEKGSVGRKLDRIKYLTSGVATDLNYLIDDIQLMGNPISNSVFKKCHLTILEEISKNVSGIRKILNVYDEELENLKKKVV